MNVTRWMRFLHWFGCHFIDKRIEYLTTGKAHCVVCNLWFITWFGQLMGEGESNAD
jgi:hypothetical protein